MRAALVQLTSSDDPVANLPITMGLINEAVAGGARFVLTPEVTNCLSTSRTHQNAVLTTESEDLTLSALRAFAEAHGIWILIGSLALKNDDDDRFANRSFMISPDGDIAARYDKMHMFDVALSETEVYRESDGYRPGETAAMSHVGDITVGMTICYDIRFPYLYRALAHAGADVLTVPSAFATETGAAHWETLLRARAIETGCYVLAPAQCGAHPHSAGRQRKTFGHSLAVDPWGRILADGGTEPCVTFLDIDKSAIQDARRRVPSLQHDREFSGPDV